MLRVEISVRPPSADELRISELGRRATEQLRLPTFMQLAGQTEAAQVVFGQMEGEIKAGVYGDSAMTKGAYLRALKKAQDLADKRAGNRPR